MAVGIRTNDPSVDVRLRRLLAPALLADVDAPVHLSLRLSASRPGEPRPKHVLYQAGCPILRSSHADELIRGLVDHLAQYAVDDGGFVWIRCVALVDADARALVLPYYLRKECALRARWLETQGFQMLTAPVVGLDPGTATVVVQPPGLDLSVEEASRIGLMPGAPSARYPLRALFAPTEEGEPGRIARASGLLAALRMALPDVDGPLAATSESFLRLAEVMARVPIYGTGLPEDARGLLGHCLRLVAMTEDPALNVAGS